MCADEEIYEWRMHTMWQALGEGMDSTQELLPLSLDEAAMAGVVRAAAAALGMRSLLVDFGIKVIPRSRMDNSAFIGMCRRQGLGKVRHLDTQAMRVQQRVRTGT